ncbi:MAG TPA: MFS transporter, partial [Nitrososphaerales archaeon]|nr:MFS transporter [Nitrososphaerales archaeon]
ELFSSILSLRALGLAGKSGVLIGAESKLGPVVAALLIGGIILLGFSQPGLGGLSDTYGRDRLVFLGEISIFGILVTLVLDFQLHTDRFLAIPFLVIFGGGLLAFTPAGLAELADIAPQTGRGSTMGLYSVIVGAGTVFAPLAGGFFLSKYGVATGFSIIFVMGLVIMAGVLFFRLSEKKSP